MGRKRHKNDRDVALSRAKKAVIVLSAVAVFFVPFGTIKIVEIATPIIREILQWINC
jgi:hypothetical protein